MPSIVISGGDAAALAAVESEATADLGKIVENTALLLGSPAAYTQVFGAVLAYQSKMMELIQEANKLEK